MSRAEPARLDPRSAPASGDRILIVDDEEANLRLITALLRREGYAELAATSDPREGVALFATFRPDLVLLDLHMPGLDGFSVLRRIRESLPPAEYLPVLILTGDTTLEAKSRALSSGATDFLAKPFDQIEALLRIRNLLETRRLHQTLRRQNQALEARVAERTRELEVALRRAEAAREAKELFLAKMSHELRTPLNAITGALELLRMRSARGADEAADRLFQTATRNVEQMGELINEILYLQRIEQGAIRLEPFPTQLSTLLEGVAERAEGRLRARGLTLRLEIPAELPRLEVDPLRLSDVLWRLLENAIRFTPHGEIVIRVLADPRTRLPLRIEVADPGIGIPPDRLIAIFEPFEQADNSITRRYEGAGIGLSLCRALCRLLGFQLTAESEPGRGSRFRVLLRPEERAAEAEPVPVPLA